MGGEHRGGLRDDLGDAQGALMYEVRREATGGWCVIGPGFYLHHSSADICEAMAALLNGYPDRAEQIIERWRA